ncbi:unknown similar to AMEV237 [Adoxophyes honmai entomopoxvirus 'L']|uniref:Uncharacterized protein n=1 Tax=Adoxophyes honmai entomopoxvirus 'L' TaxID=1293540 RepID=A0A916KPC9_9POXV|nr:unknown similar to AMEV237 [Adoxophyes honmai entomopoxvirus 'L']CCU55537.1 unknown similar to AMEV237 [Adoxophyes honmai entomopoxvirus 'L']
MDTETDNILEISEKDYNEILQNINNEKMESYKQEHSEELLKLVFNKFSKTFCNLEDVNKKVINEELEESTEEESTEEELDLSITTEEESTEEESEEK